MSQYTISGNPDMSLSSKLEESMIITTTSKYFLVMEIIYDIKLGEYRLKLYNLSDKKLLDTNLTGLQIDSNYREFKGSIVLTQ